MTKTDAGRASLGRRGREMLAAMLEISPEAIIVADADARILAFSAGAEEIFGYRAREVAGDPIERLLPTRFRTPHRRHVAGFASGSSQSLRMHDRSPVVGRRKSGEEFPAEASLAKLKTPTGYAFVAIIRDLTERRAAELRLIEAREQAENASVAKSVFLANMSHEIRTPLNGVLGIAGALAGTDLNPNQRKMVDLIESSGRALERLLTDILDLAKLDAGRTSVREEAFDLGGLVRDTVELFRASAVEKGIELTAEVSERAWDDFLGDELKIRQVLSNLVSNGVKFTSQGGVRLSVSVAPSDDGEERVRFVVSDTGIGFSAEAAEKLFERFEQADASITRRYGGTGLGLAISKSIAGLMKGSISATSKPGCGATFRFELPLRRADRDLARRSRMPVPDSGLPIRPMRVLLAEDHVVNRMTVELILEPLPVEIVAVENGQEAVEAFSPGHFDFILMDMQMPVMDGLAAIRHIRDRESEAGGVPVPICVLTANAMAEHRMEAEAAGADAFLTKPINAQALIEHVLRVAQADREGASSP